MLRCLRLLDLCVLEVVGLPLLTVVLPVGLGVVPAAAAVVVDCVVTEQLSLSAPVSL